MVTARETDDAARGAAGKAAGAAAGKTAGDAAGDTSLAGAAGLRPGADMPSPLERELMRLAGRVPDPELPVISLAELGVLRGLRVLGPGRVRVELTPTWTGCPALRTMADDITEVLTAHGVAEVAVETVLAPAWTTDAISPEGRRKLAEAGVAPPRPGASARQVTGGPVQLDLAIRCPRCGATDTRLLSRFSSTACKALRRCASCGEPFDHFKEV
jgi:ring-1,2-phenylacetyl-CoA epoxidase subunit PaaD